MTFSQLPINQQNAFLHLLANLLALAERNPELARKAVKAATGTAGDSGGGWPGK